MFEINFIMFEKGCFKYLKQSSLFTYYFYIFTERIYSEAAFDLKWDERRTRDHDVCGHIPRAGDRALHAVLHGAAWQTVQAGIQQCTLYHSD